MNNEKSSFKWIIEHGQYELLKYKLNTGEYINVTKESIELFFNAFNKCSIDEVPLLEEILRSFLNDTKRRVEFEICDLTQLAISCNSIKAFNILTNEPYSIMVYPSTLKHAIQNCDVTITQTLLNKFKSNAPDCNSCNILTKPISWASKNKQYMEEMIDFIIEELYESNEIIEHDDVQVVKFESDEDEDQDDFGDEYLEYDGDEEDEEDNGVEELEELKDLKLDEENEEEGEFIDLESFLSIKSLKTRNNLLKFGLVSNYKNVNYNFSFAIQDSFEEIVFKYNVHHRFANSELKFGNLGIQFKINELRDSQQLNEIEKLKQLQKLMFIESGSKCRETYKQFIIKYQETISELPMV